jgi:hypothetical protein
MKKFSAEEQVAAVLKALALDTQFEVDALRKDMALFALFVWVAVARKIIRESRRQNGLYVNETAAIAQAILATKFRAYEKRLAAQIEGILLARKAGFKAGMLRITGDVKYAKTRKVTADGLSFMVLTLHQTFATLLQTFQQRLVLRLRSDLLQSENARLSSVIGPAFADAEELYDRLGGSFPDDDFPKRQQFATAALNVLPKTGPVPRLVQELGQIAGDFAHTGLIDTIWPILSHASSTAGVSVLVTVDERTGVFCTGLLGGMWNVETGKSLPQSAVSVDFPGPPPYHPNCRSIIGPVFHQGLVFKSGVAASGQAPDFSSNSWLDALPSDERDYYGRTASTG